MAGIMSGLLNLPQWVGRMLKPEKGIIANGAYNEITFCY